MNELVPINQYLSEPNVNKYLTQLLAERKGAFVVAMSTMVNGNKALMECDRNSLVAVGLTAVGMNLSMSPSLGHCFAVPYRNNGVRQAQFQMGWKGFVQLALRTSQYKFINVAEVYQNQFRSWDKFNEILNADFTIDGKGKIVGYVAKFILASGFVKTIYWKTESIQAHGMKYSKTYADGQWTKDFDGMAKKTMIKQLISKFGPMSTELEEAITKDQAVIERDFETGAEVIQYADNPQNDDSAEPQPIDDVDAREYATATDVTPLPEPPPVHQQAPAKQSADGGFIIPIGRHKGQTLEHVYDSDAGWLDWYLAWDKAREPMLSIVKRFIEEKENADQTAISATNDYFANDNTPVPWEE
jgi:recombination protein RecT